MLSNPSRFITRIDKAVIKNIVDQDWFCVNRSGMGVVLSTLPSKASVKPGSTLLMALGACAADDVKIHFEEKGHKIKSVNVKVVGEKESTPHNRIADIKIHFEVDTDKGADVEEMRSVAQNILDNLCPVANTINCKPNITVKAILKKH